MRIDTGLDPRLEHRRPTNGFDQMSGNRYFEVAPERWAGGATRARASHAHSSDLGVLGVAVGFFQAVVIGPRTLKPPGASNFATPGASGGNFCTHEKTSSDDRRPPLDALDDPLHNPKGQSSGCSRSTFRR
jgi:hypothetical protein